MEIWDINYPIEVDEIHEAIGLKNVFRAKLVDHTPGTFRHQKPTFDYGFVSVSASAIVYTKLSMMVDYSTYGMRKIIRYVASGRDLDEAIDSVAGHWGMGECEIPHIESVITFHFCSIKDPAFKREHIDRSVHLFYKKTHDVEIFAMNVLRFTSDGKQFSIESPDERIKNLSLALQGW